MRMQRSLAQLEQEFREETIEEQERRARLRREAAIRSRYRRAERVSKQGNWRFGALVAAILLTSVIVTIVMFETLALLVSP